MEKRQQPDISGELMKNRVAITKLASSQEARQLMGLLEGMNVQQAARSAVKGDPAALMEMVQGLVNSKRGAELAQRIQEQARQAGLSDV
jgi:gamma-glutamyltranspeptidase